MIHHYLFVLIPERRPQLYRYSLLIFILVVTDQRPLFFCCFFNFRILFGFIDTIFLVISLRILQWSLLQNVLLVPLLFCFLRVPFYIFFSLSCQRLSSIICWPYLSIFMFKTLVGSFVC